MLCPSLTVWPCKSDQQCRSGTNCAENHRLSIRDHAQGTLKTILGK